MDTVTVRVRFLDFLKTGVFAGLTLGATEEQILAVLGAPEGNTLRGKLRIWTYGSLEVTLSDGRLAQLAIHYLQNPAGTAKGVVVEGWAAQRTTTIEELESVAKEAGIPLRQSPQTFFDDFLPYEFDSGVTAIFLKNFGVTWLDKIFLETPPGRFSRP